MDTVTPPKPPLFAQWRIIALVLAIIVAALGFWYYLAVRDTNEVLYADLRPADAAAVIADLNQRGIRFQTGENGRQILVPSSQMAQARASMAPGSGGPHAIEGFELFDTSDMGLNEFDERVRYQRAIQGELERTIMTMDGVVSTRVHISVGDRSPFRSEQQPTGAAVELVMRSPQDETPGRVEGIQRLVAASVTGITAADVVVLNGRGEVLSPRVEITDISNTLLGGDGEARRTAIDLVTQVMRAALPDRQFEISIEQAAASPVSGASTSAPASPVFTRIIKIATETALTDLEKEHVRAALHNAGLVDGSLEQTILFSVGLSSDETMTNRVAGANTAPGNGAHPQTQHPAPSSLGFVSWALLGLLLLALGIGGFFYRARLRAPLSASEHQQFAQRLRAALGAQEEADAL